MYDSMTYPSSILNTYPTVADAFTGRFSLIIREARADTDDFWGEPIHVYTRQQAIEDGVLFDASSGDIAPVSLQHFGPKAHVAMTAALHDLIERAVENPRTWNDWRGVLHDVCWMSTVWQVKKEKTEFSQTVWFEVTIVGAGRKRKHLLKRHMQPDGEGGVEITFMLPNED